MAQNKKPPEQFREARSGQKRLSSRNYLKPLPKPVGVEVVVKIKVTLYMLKLKIRTTRIILQLRIDVVKIFFAVYDLVTGAWILFSNDWKSHTPLSRARIHRVSQTDQSPPKPLISCTPPNENNSNYLGDRMKLDFGKILPSTIRHSSRCQPSIGMSIWNKYIHCSVESSHYCARARRRRRFTKTLLRGSL